MGGKVKIHVYCAGIGCVVIRWKGGRQSWNEIIGHNEEGKVELSAPRLMLSITSKCWCRRNTWLAHVRGKPFDVQCQEMRRGREGDCMQKDTIFIIWAHDLWSLPTLIHTWIKHTLVSPRCHPHTLPPTYLCTHTQTHTHSGFQDCPTTERKCYHDAILVGHQGRLVDIPLVSSSPLSPSLAFPLSSPSLSPSMAGERRPVFVNSIT